MAARKKFPITAITGALALIMALAVGFGNSAQSQTQRGDWVHGAFSPTIVQVCPARGDNAYARAERTRNSSMVADISKGTIVRVLDENTMGGGTAWYLIRWVDSEDPARRFDGWVQAHDLSGQCAEALAPVRKQEVVLLQHTGTPNPDRFSTDKETPPSNTRPVGALGRTNPAPTAPTAQPSVPRGAENTPKSTMRVETEDLPDRHYRAILDSLPRSIHSTGCNSVLGRPMAESSRSELQALLDCLDDRDKSENLAITTVIEGLGLKLVTLESGDLRIEDDGDSDACFDVCWEKVHDRLWAITMRTNLREVARSQARDALSSR